MFSEPGLLSPKIAFGSGSQAFRLRMGLVLLLPSFSYLQVWRETTPLAFPCLQLADGMAASGTSQLPSSCEPIPPKKSLSSHLCVTYWFIVSGMSDSATPRTQAPVCMEFSRPEYWSGLPFLSPGDLPDPGIEPGSVALQADSLLSELPGTPLFWRTLS